MTIDIHIALDDGSKYLLTRVNEANADKIIHDLFVGYYSNNHMVLLSLGGKGVAAINASHLVAAWVDITSVGAAL